MDNGGIAVQRRSSHLVLLAIVDFVLTSSIALIMFFFFFSATDVELSGNYLAAITTLSVIVLLCSAAFGLYDASRPIFSWNVMRRLVMAWFMIVATVALVVVMTKTNYTFSRVWFFSTVITAFLFSLIWRIGAHRRVLNSLQQNASQMDVLAIGVNGQLDALVQRLQSKDKLAYRSIRKWEWQGGHFATELSQMMDAFKGTNICHVWVAGGGLDNQVAGRLVQHFSEELVQINYYPDISFLPGPSARIRNHAGLVEVSLSVRPLRSLDRWLKSTVDLIFSTLVLILISPLMLVLAIGVKVSSPGPVFFRQQRLTENGKPFDMLKFRTMPIAVEEETGPVWAKPNENRATRFGQFLRRTSLDELPQFINVLKGEMAVVGPRPERPFFVEQFQHSVPAYMQKHYVKAGITGWAQINGLRGNTSIEKRIEHDLFYIQNWSAWLDIKIMIMTVFSGFISRSAY